MDITNEHQVGLTSGEISNLWISYMNGSMAACIITYFLEKVEDPSIKTILEYAYSLTQKNDSRIKQFFTEEHYPFPKGFSDGDVNPKAPRLYSDSFFLVYLANMGKFGLTANSLSLSTSSRSDIRTFFSECLADMTNLFNKSTDLMLEKGLHIRPPYIPIPGTVETVLDQNFMGNFLNIGTERPLLAVEISNLIFNLHRNTVGKALIIGFSQVAKSKEVRQFFDRGRDIAKKHIDVFSSVLSKEDLPVPMTWDAEVTACTESPFSDKLMMFHITLLIASGIGQYGIAASCSPRADLATMYFRLAGEIGHYSDDGANIMIKNGWMEKPPQSVNRKELAKV